MVLLTTLRAEREILIILLLRESVRENELETIVNQNLRNSVFNFKNILNGLVRQKFIQSLVGIEDNKTCFSYRITEKGKIRLDDLDKKFNDNKLIEINNNQLQFNKKLVLVTTILAIGVLFEMFTKIINFYRLSDFTSMLYPVIGIIIVFIIIKTFK